MFVLIGVISRDFVYFFVILTKSGARSQTIVIVRLTPGLHGVPWACDGRWPAMRYSRSFALLYHIIIIIIIIALAIRQCAA